MSMMGYLNVLSPSQLTAFRARPALASDFADLTASDALRKTLEAGLAQAPPAMRKQYEAARRDMLKTVPGMAKEYARRDTARLALRPLEPFAPPLILGKAWHVLHYLMTGHADGEGSPGAALMNGEPMGEDLGYGPPLANDPADTRHFADFLARLDADQLAARIDLQAMARLSIYPLDETLDDQQVEAWRETVRTLFPQLKTYVSRAAAQGGGLLVWLT